jgi:hypothetical protein
MLEYGAMVADRSAEPVLSPRFRLGFGMLAFGIGFMFFSGKTLPHPVPAGIAVGITLGIVGLVVVIVEALREPPEGSPQSTRGGAAPLPPAAPHHTESRRGVDDGLSVRVGRTAPP